MVNILGLYWDVSTDRIHYSPRLIDFTSDTDVTKKKILQQSSRIFDALGFLSPVTICAKLLMQELWVRNTSWDEPLEDSMKAKWSEIIKSLQKAIQVSIPRKYFPSDNSSDKTQEIHTFADVSLKAYGAVVYIQQGDCITFLIAKTKVAPLSKLTFPKLELMAALVAIRLTNFAVNSLGECCRDMPIHLWSDSQIVLHWISSKKQLKQKFVSHRIQEIIQAFPSKMWNYCLTGDNPVVY